MLIAGPRHPHAILDEYATHYNHHRPHRARNLRPPGAAEATPTAITGPTMPKARRRRVLGGYDGRHEVRQLA